MIGKDFNNIYDIKYNTPNGTIAAGGTVQFQIPQGTYLTNSTLTFIYEQTDANTQNMMIRDDCTPFISKCVVMLDGVKVYDVLNLSTLQRQWYQKMSKGVGLNENDFIIDQKYFQPQSIGTGGKVTLSKEIKLNHFLAYLFDDYQKSFVVNQQMTISVSIQFTTKIGSIRANNYVDLSVGQSAGQNSNLTELQIKLKQIVQASETYPQRIIQQLALLSASDGILTFFVDGSQISLYNIISLQSQPTYMMNDYMLTSAFTSLKLRRNNQLIFECSGQYQIGGLRYLDQENQQQDNIYSGILQYETSGEQVQFQFNCSHDQDLYITNVVIPKPLQQQ